MTTFDIFIKISLIVTPVLLVIVAGYFYGRVAKPDAGWTNRMNLDVFLPVWIFYAMSGRTYDAKLDTLIIIGAIGIIVGSALLAWPIGKLTGVSPKTLLPSVMFCNCGNMGLPLTLYAFGEALIPSAVLIFVATNLLFFTFGTWLISGRADWRETVTSPMVVATGVGLVVGVLGLRLPSVLQDTIKLLANITLPLLLFTLGVRLYSLHVSDWRVGLLGAVVRPICGLAAAWAILPLLPLTSEAKAVLFLFAALPPAVVNFLLAEKFSQEPQKVAAIALVGNLASLLFVPLGLYIALRQ